MRVDGEGLRLLRFLGSCWAFFEVSLMEKEADSLRVFLKSEGLR